MKTTKKLFLTGMACYFYVSVFAGGLLTNTNQNVTFLRNLAREASMEIDAAYTNPAGLAFLKKDGFSLSLNNQCAFQTRTITTTFAPFSGFGGNAEKAFEGKVSSYVIPNLQAAYKKDNWVISSNIGVVGGGGTLDFSKGLPSFESQIAIVPKVLQQNGIPATQYSLDSRLQGSSMTLGVQLGVTYKLSEQFSAYLGGRMSIVDNSYDGYLRDIQIKMADGTTKVGDYLAAAATQLTGAGNSLKPIIDLGYGNAPLSMMVGAGVLSQAQVDQLLAGSGCGKDATVNAVQTAFFQKATIATGTAAQIASNTGDKQLLCTQKGSGFAPILGFDFKSNGLNIGVKYEFKTKLELKNETETNTTGVKDFDNNEKTPYDIPALLTIGAQYDILPQLTVSAGYHHFFDSNAKMAHDKQKLINGGVNEYLAGVEYRINERFLVSCGTQFTRQGVTDAYQSDMAFSINSYSLGFGGAVNITKNIRVNLAYFLTNYNDWTVNFPTDYHGLSAANGLTGANLVPGKDIYGRTNYAFGIGVDFCF